jgi:hypothetical protein
MSSNPLVSDSATRAQEKVASQQASKARTDFAARLSKMAADWEARLVLAGITVEDEPEPDMTGIPAVDYSRRVEMTTAMPVNIPTASALNRV